VLAAVRPDALDHGLGATVPDGEAHARSTDQMEPATGGAVQAGVAGDRLAGCDARQIGLWTNDHHAAGQALRDVVVGHALELEGQPGGQEGPETLTSGAAC